MDMDILEKVGVSISLGLCISRTLAIESISMGIRVSIVSSISKMSISSIEKVRISISLGLSISRTLAIVSYMTIGVPVVSSISKVSQAISISSIQKVRVSISLGLGLGLSNGNSSQKNNGKCFHHLDASPT